MRNKNIDWAWLAGFIDGDGTITIWRLKNKSKFSYAPVISIGNTNPDAVQKAARMLNTNVKSRKQGNKKTVYSIHFGGQKVKFILKKLLPYLIAKKKHAEILLKYIFWKEKKLEKWDGYSNLYTTKERQKMEKYYQKIARLQIRGKG